MTSQNLKCKLCNHEWMPRSEEIPVACPRCKRYDWIETKEVKVNGN